MLPKSGINDWCVKRKHVRQLVTDVIDTSTFSSCNANSEITENQFTAKTYSDNRKLWEDLLSGKVGQGESLLLDGCHLLDWMPSCPGRYFTPEATKSREEALLYWSDDEEEYFPLGKLGMVLGGVGSVRLAPRDVPGGKACFFGATFSGISHEGIPVVVPIEHGKQLLQSIRSQGSCFGSVSGTLWPLPVEHSPIKFDRGIPKYYMFSDNIKIYSANQNHKCNVTISITFDSETCGVSIPLGDFRFRSQKSWCFASFDPSDGIAGIEKCISWMKSYVYRHCKYSEEQPIPLRIVGDFDEIYQHFEQSVVDFPLSETLRGQFDPMLIRLYADFFKLEVNNNFEFKGDIFNGIYNSSIINKSDIDRAIISVRNSLGESHAGVMSSASDAVSPLQNPAAAALLKSIVDELNRGNKIDRHRYEYLVIELLAYLYDK